jgi:periplasmic protein CpxP/Spy
MSIKTMTNRVLSIAGMLLVGTFAPTMFAQSSAQDQSAPPAAAPAGHARGERMFEGLNLSDDQKVQIKQIHLGAKAKSDAVMADTSLSDADKKTKVKEIHRGAMMQARALLTPAQREQLKANRKERKAERSETSPS